MPTPSFVAGPALPLRRRSLPLRRPPPIRRLQPCLSASPPAAPTRSRRPLKFLTHLLQTTRLGAPYSSLRFASLPLAVQTPAQMLGRLSPGCEGTHGVFPKCNFACTPCYHSADANRVRVDGMHTLTETASQMALLEAQRGPVGHCQLIGGEVSLLPAEDHAAALEVMRFYGRVPMSFSHGDFDYAYLKRLALREDGTRRFERLDFAVHFDMFMHGRRKLDGSPGVMHAASEDDLTPYRQRFVDMFHRLRREHGVKFYLAHNMTIQPGNVDQIPGVVRSVRDMGFRMLSFQPAAEQGDRRRWTSEYASIARDDGQGVWERIQDGAGARLPYKLFQMGDLRCNRTCLCGIVGEKIVPFFDDESDADAKFRDKVIMRNFGNLVLKPHELVLKILRFAVFRFWLLPAVAAWAGRFCKRAGGVGAVVRHRVWTITFVMHRFMDAENVQKAWDMMESGITADDPRKADAGEQVQETIERLSACSYGMGQVGQDRVVPACVQHSIYDPAENIALTEELPLSEPAVPAVPANL